MGRALSGPTRLGTIEDMRRRAASRGGSCVSEEYINNATPLRWRCSEGHEWLSPPREVPRSWCSICAGNQPPTLAELRALARSRGGKLLSRLYENTVTPLLWQCAGGHTWRARPGKVKHGNWCPHCPRGGWSTAQLTIQDMRDMAKGRGGKCLSDRYVQSDVKLLWRCAEGHEWLSTPRTLKRGSWCPVCAHNQTLTIEELQARASKRGGRCLATIYTNIRTPVLWECGRGHKWEAKPSAVRKGTWCPVCARMRHVPMEKVRESVTAAIRRINKPRGSG